MVILDSVYRVFKRLEVCSDYRIFTPSYKYRGKTPLIPPVNTGEYEDGFILSGFPSFYLVGNAKLVFSVHLNWNHHSQLLQRRCCLTFD